MRSRFSFHLCALAVVLGLASVSCLAENAASTAIPVSFTRTLEAGKAHPGDVVIAKTMQAVTLEDGRQIPKGSALTGHVIESRGFVFDPTPYAVQKPSVLSIRFDTLAENGSTVPVNLSVRALSNAVESYEASIPQFANDADTIGTRVLIGGDEFQPLQKELSSPQGDTVGYIHDGGVYARLLPGMYLNRNAEFSCDGTRSEQSVAIFSASACGLYGYSSTYMPENGSKGDGAFTLESRNGAVRLQAQSAALLQVVPHRS